MRLIAVSISLLVVTIILSGCISDSETNMYQIKESNVISIEGKGEYKSIQEAIDAASIKDTIYVTNGYYFENIDINKSITLIGENKDTTIIDGHNSSDVIYIAADYVTIRGFTITNGGFQKEEKKGAGIDIQSSYNTIADCNVSSNKNHGLYLGGNSKNNSIVNTLFSQNKNGIYTTYAKTNHISFNTFSGNTGYGLYLSTSSHDNQISNNTFKYNTYAIRVKGSERNIITYNRIMNNNKGLYFCCGAPNNFAYMNSFINNSNWHAKENLYNTWDNGRVGNYWDNYHGADTNNDGIGDTTYLLHGDKGDRFPLMNIP